MLASHTGVWDLSRSLPSDERGRVRRIRLALLLGALALFALLYAPQAVLPRLSVDFEVSPGVVALLISTATLGLAVAAIPLGTLSEAVGRRRTMVVALVTAEVIGLLLPWTSGFLPMVLLRFVQGAAIAGLAAVAAAYLAEETGTAQLGTTLGLYVAGTTVGGMSGRILCGVTADFLGWQAGMFAVALLAAICTVAFVALLPTERTHRAAPLRAGPLLNGLRRAVGDRRLLAPYVVALLGMGAFVTVYNVLTFRLIAPPLNVPPAPAALAFLAYAAGTVSSALGGRAADHWGRVPVLLCGLTVAVIGLALMLPDSLTSVLVGLIVFTGGFFMAHSVANGWVGEHADASARGQASSLYQFCYYMGSAIGGLIGGWAYAVWGWTVMTSLLTAWFVIAGVAVLLGGRLLPRRIDRSPEH